MSVILFTVAALSMVTCATTSPFLITNGSVLVLIPAMGIYHLPFLSSHTAFTKPVAVPDCKLSSTSCSLSFVSSSLSSASLTRRGCVPTRSTRCVSSSSTIVSHATPGNRNSCSCFLLRSSSCGSSCLSSSACISLIMHNSSSLCFSSSCSTIHVV